MDNTEYQKALRECVEATAELHKEIFGEEKHASAFNEQTVMHYFSGMSDVDFVSDGYPGKDHAAILEEYTKGIKSFGFENPKAIQAFAKHELVEALDLNKKGNENPHLTSFIMNIAPSSFHRSHEEKCNIGDIHGIDIVALSPEEVQKELALVPDRLEIEDLVQKSILAFSELYQEVVGAAPVHSDIEGIYPALVPQMHESIENKKSEMDAKYTDIQHAIDFDGQRDLVKCNVLLRDLYNESYKPEDAPAISSAGEIFLTATGLELTDQEKFSPEFQKIIRDNNLNTVEAIEAYAASLDGAEAPVSSATANPEFPSLEEKNTDGDSSKKSNNFKRFMIGVALAVTAIAGSIGGARVFSNATQPAPSSGAEQPVAAAVASSQANTLSADQLPQAPSIGAINQKTSSVPQKVQSLLAKAEIDASAIKPAMDVLNGEETDVVDADRLKTLMDVGGVALTEDKVMSQFKTPAAQKKALAYWNTQLDEQYETFDNARERIAAETLKAYNAIDTSVGHREGTTARALDQAAKAVAGQEGKLSEKLPQLVSAYLEEQPMLKSAVPAPSIPVASSPRTPAFAMNPLAATQQITSLALSVADFAQPSYDASLSADSFNADMFAAAMLDISGRG